MRPYKYIRNHINVTETFEVKMFIRIIFRSNCNSRIHLEITE